MEKEPLIDWAWHGHEAIESIPSLLNRAERIEIPWPPTAIPD